ncbi:hypothetical protein [Flavobacterium sp. UW10123]|uniref:hypothetical protein n=1 Tax=Flavobacterium sp. UW10123 TaxID=3230800 RepID=UPI0025E70ED9|nr:hypothetical protein [uncultured Flavobacterium sp.]
MKKIFFSLLVLFMAGCTNDNNTFTLRTIRLNDYKGRTALPPQKLYFKVFKSDSEVPLTQTGFYPSDYTMPATFKVFPSAEMQLYGKAYNVQLWSETKGCLGRCDIDMDEYKIVFPIDMEVKNDSLNIAIQGTWE